MSTGHVGSLPSKAKKKKNQRPGGKKKNKKNEEQRGQAHVQLHMCIFVQK